MSVVGMTAWVLVKVTGIHALKLVLLAVAGRYVGTTYGRERTFWLALVVLLLLLDGFAWGTSDWLVQHRIFGKPL